ncbi:ABC transporter substrate-binding protein [Halobacteria archaeon AArc-m2/3/4]|uniref:ABC transporter substrate-binding protein n=1 Tax=Natronoglomus mannanivorans TaxID=2979990 RepID=A0ABT2QEJ2_9EURY|nr:ABC transporter substrate-binding protein [Halobacteria archaeon AArc-m2/3/4]
MPSAGPSFLSRRAVLAATSGGIAAIAGCTTDDGSGANGNENGNGTETETGTDPDPTEQHDREIQTEWIQAVPMEASNLSPYWVNDYASSLRIGLHLDGAYTLDENGDFYSLWVDDYENRGNDTYAFTLRDSLEWGGDYGAMTADDWVWFYHNVIDTDENWVGYLGRDDWRNVESVDAEDRHTFVVELEQSDPLFVKRPTMWGTSILPRALTEPYYQDWQDGDDGAGEALNTADEVLEFRYAGNLGPYEFERRDLEDRYVGTRNDDYYRQGTEPDADDWADAPYFDRYVIRVLPTQSTRLSEFRSGGLTYTELPADQAQSFEDDDDITVVSTPTPFNRITVYNQRANGWEPLRNRRVRQALSMAIDKRTVVDHIFDGNAETAHTFQPTYSEFYDDSHVTPFGDGESYDPEQARSLLAEELSGEYGYDGDTLLGPEGTQVQLDLVYQTGETVYEDTGRYIADALDELGIAVDQRATPADVLFERYAEQEDDSGNAVFNAGDRDEYTSSDDWDLMWSISLNTFPYSPGSNAPVFTQGGSFNFFGYVPEDDLEGLFSDAMSADDLETQQDRFAEIFGILSRDQPFNFMLFDNRVHGYQREVVHTESVSPSWGYKNQTFWATEGLHD